MDNKINEMVNQWMSDWNKRFEEFQVQFTLGKMDAAENFEKYKELMRNSVSGWKASLDKLDDKSDAYLRDVRATLEELMVQLNLGKAEGKEAFEAQRTKIEQLLRELKQTGKATYDENFDRMMRLFEQSSQTFKTGLEIVQLQYTLGKMEAKDKALEVQKEVTAKLEEMNRAFKEAQDIGMEQMEAWKKNMLTGYRQMNIWVEEWLKKMK